MDRNVDNQPGLGKHKTDGCKQVLLERKGTATTARPLFVSKRKKGKSKRIETTKIKSREPDNGSFQTTRRERLRATRDTETKPMHINACVCCGCCIASSFGGFLLQRGRDDDDKDLLLRARIFSVLARACRVGFRRLFFSHTHTRAHTHTPELVVWHASVWKKDVCSKH